MSGVRLGALLAARAILLIPATGPWVADLDIDLGASTLPSGRVAVTIGDEPLVGTVDPTASGRNGTLAAVRVVAGANGWSQPVAAQQFHNDFGVTSAAVLAATAASVGESIVVATPKALGVDYVRSAGPASRVLRGASWYVDAAGVTQVAPRPSTPMPGGVRVLEWDPLVRRAVLAADTIVWPGTVLTDTRFGTMVVREAEHAYTSDGSRVTAWCETGATSADELAGVRLVRAIGIAAAEAIRPTWLRRHPYRVVTQSAIDGRVTLQAVRRGGDVPDALQAVAAWPSLAGVRQTYAPGTVVLVAFIGGDPALPIVVEVDPRSSTPEKTVLDADDVSIGTDGTAVVIQSDDLVTWIAGVSAFTGVAAPRAYASRKLRAE